MNGVRQLTLGWVFSSPFTSALASALASALLVRLLVRLLVHLPVHLLVRLPVRLLAHPWQSRSLQECCGVFLSLLNPILHRI
jgi:hypothetical protein